MFTDFTRGVDAGQERRLPGAALGQSWDAKCRVGWNEYRGLGLNDSSRLRGDRAPEGAKGRHRCGEEWIYRGVVCAETKTVEEEYQNMGGWVVGWLDRWSVGHLDSCSNN